MHELKAPDNSMMTQMTSLHEERLDFVLRTLKSTGARRVLDLGCGSGSLLYRMLADPQFESITGLEDSGVSLQQARAVLAEYLCEETPRIRLVRGSYAESNPTLTGYDAVAMVETIEHVRPEQLSRVERAVFGEYRPGYLFMTTPNREYNPLFDLAPMVGGAIFGLLYAPLVITGMHHMFLAVDLQLISTQGGTFIRPMIVMSTSPSD